MVKNLILSLILVQIWSQKISFVGFTSIRCYILLQATLYAIARKTNEPNLRKCKKKKKKLVLAPKIFLWILTPLGVRNCCKLSLYSIPRKTNEPNLRKWQKNLVLGLTWPKFGVPIFFFFSMDFT